MSGELTLAVLESACMVDIFTSGRIETCSGAQWTSAMSINVPRIQYSKDVQRILRIALCGAQTHASYSSPSHVLVTTKSHPRSANTLLLLGKDILHGRASKNSFLEYTKIN
jgi:hypothetical protein